MEVTLSGMQPAPRADALARRKEVFGGRFVRPHLLRRHQRVEVDTEVAKRSSEQIVVHVRKDAEPVACGSEPFESRVRIGEGMPTGEAVSDECRPVLDYRPAELFCNTPCCFGEYCPVGAEGFRFDHLLYVSVCCERGGSFARHTQPRRGLLEPYGDAV